MEQIFIILFNSYYVNYCNIDEQPLLDDIDEEGVGMVAIRRADYDDTPETEKKREEMLFIPSVFSSKHHCRNHSYMIFF